MTEQKELRLFIKWLYPAGTVIQDYTCSEPFTIKKNSVYKIHVWEANDYNDESRPKDRKDYNVEFLVRDPGKNNRWHSIDRWFSLGDCLAIYQDKPARWLTGVKTYLHTEDKVEITNPDAICYCVKRDNLKRFSIVAKNYVWEDYRCSIVIFSTEAARTKYINKHYLETYKTNKENLKILVQILKDGVLTDKNVDKLDTFVRKSL